VVTHATFWAMVAIAVGAWPLGVLAMAVRLAAGIRIGRSILRDPAVLRHFYLIPLRDLWGFAIWICGLFGTTVEWRGQRLKISAGGKILTPRM